MEAQEQQRPIREYIGILGDGISRVTKLDGAWSFKSLEKEIAHLMRPKRTFNATTRRWVTGEKPSAVKVFYIQTTIPKAEILPLAILLQRAENWHEMKVADEILYGPKDPVTVPRQGADQ